MPNRGTVALARAAATAVAAALVCAFIAACGSPADQKPGNLSNNSGASTAAANGTVPSGSPLSQSSSVAAPDEPGVPAASDASQGSGREAGSINDSHAPSASKSTTKPGTTGSKPQPTSAPKPTAPPPSTQPGTTASSDPGGPTMGSRPGGSSSAPPSMSTR